MYARDRHVEHFFPVGDANAAECFIASEMYATPSSTEGVACT